MNCALCILFVAIFILFEVQAVEKCGKSPKCSCQFGADGELPVAASGSDGRNIGLAAATGALGSMIMAGGGFALWRFIKCRSAPKFDNQYGRPPSSNSSTGSWMDDKRKDPLADHPRRGSNPSSLPDIDMLNGNDTFERMSTSKPRNIYHMGRVWTGHDQLI